MSPGGSLRPLGGGQGGTTREAIEPHGEIGAGPMETCGQGEICFASESIVLSIYQTFISIRG